MILAVLTIACALNVVLAGRDLTDHSSSSSMVERHQQWMTKYGHVTTPRLIYRDRKLVAKDGFNNIQSVAKEL
jgi:hypothetical protein